MMAFIGSPKDLQLHIAERARQRRLALNLTQAGLASRVDTSLSTIRRFEKDGIIALSQLVRVAVVLDAVDEFMNLFSQRAPQRSLKELLEEAKTRKRGRLK